MVELFSPMKICLFLLVDKVVTYLQALGALKWQLSSSAVVSVAEEK